MELWKLDHKLGQIVELTEKRCRGASERLFVDFVEYWKLARAEALVE